MLDRPNMVTKLTILSEPEEEIGIFKVVFVHHMMDVVGLNEKLS